MPRRLGQHFLADTRYQQRITEALHLTASDTVLEIGAGRGAMTRWLAEQAGRVIAVELDPLLVTDLRRTFSDHPHVEILEGDILRVPLPPGRMRCFGNLPYYITAPILLKLFEHAAQFDEIVVMVQREVGERIVAQPGSRDYAFLSVTAQFYTRPKLLFTIPPGAFKPAPKVESALVRMVVEPRGAVDPAFFRMVKAAFAQKRKTLFNNLKPVYGEERARHALERTGIDGRSRAEQLPLDRFQELFLALGAGG